MPESWSAVFGTALDVPELWSAVFGTALDRPPDA
jgi:hypothetical protein